MSRVTICRDLAAGESVGFDPNCNGPRIYIGDAVLIDGARPDVQAANPSMPLNTRGGWGYLLLTNFLPKGGNGTFTLHAYAIDLDGHTIEIGPPKAITVNNAQATRPFGAIDRPTQGEAICGVFLNAGWALTQPNKDTPADSSTIAVAIDNTAVGHPGVRAARSDITGAFAAGGYDTTHAAGGFGLDTTTLSNGTHTIFWFVTDSGRAVGRDRQPVLYRRQSVSERAPGRSECRRCGAPVERDCLDRIADRCRPTLAARLPARRR